MTLTIPLILIAIAAVLWLVLRRLAERERIGAATDVVDNMAEHPTWSWPTWPVERPAGDRQPRARRYSARERSST